MREPVRLGSMRRRTPRRARTLGVAMVGLLMLLAAPTAVLANDPALTVEKTPDAGAVAAGGVIGFTITVRINTTTEPDPLCLVVSASVHQCPAVNVVLRDQLPASPVGLVWTIDNANSDPGCDIGVTTPGYLTCNWGTLTQPNEVRRVHITSPTGTAFGSLCGTVTNALVTVTYDTADGTNRSVSDTDRSIGVACATPPPTPKSSVQQATTPPKVTLPPTDAAAISDGETEASLVAPILLMVAFVAAGLTIAHGRRAPRD